MRIIALMVLPYVIIAGVTYGILHRENNWWEEESHLFQSIFWPLAILFFFGFVIFNRSARLGQRIANHLRKPK